MHAGSLLTGGSGGLANSQVLRLDQSSLHGPEAGGPSPAVFAIYQARLHVSGYAGSLMVLPTHSGMRRTTESEK